MNGPRPKNLRATALGIFLALGAACATVPPEPYDGPDAAMQAEVEPLCETLIPQELTKDPEAVDYLSIQASALRVRDIFSQMQAPARQLYAKDAKTRKHAATAEAWFRSLAAAAAAEDHGKLVRIFVGKKQICANCHG